MISQRAVGTFVQIQDTLLIRLQAGLRNVVSYLLLVLLQDLFSDWTSQKESAAQNQDFQEKTTYESDKLYTSKSTVQA